MGKREKMNPDTGAIAYFENDEDAKKAGHTVKLSTAEAAVLYGTSRQQRRAKLAEMRASKRKQQKASRRKNRGK